MIDGDKVGTAGHRGVGGPQQTGTVHMEKEGEEKRERRERIERKTHFGRDQADFGLYLYE